MPIPWGINRERQNRHSDLAVAPVNRAITHVFGARRLPSMALRDGVTDDLRTMVVPTLLTSRTALDELHERLEVHSPRAPAANLTSPSSPIGPTPRPSVSTVTRRC